MRPSHGDAGGGSHSCRQCIGGVPGRDGSDGTGTRGIASWMNVMRSRHISRGPERCRIASDWQRRTLAPAGLPLRSRPCRHCPAACRHLKPVHGCRAGAPQCWQGWAETRGEVFGEGHEKGGTARRWPHSRVRVERRASHSRHEHQNIQVMQSGKERSAALGQN